MLISFLKSYYKWVSDGANPHPVFTGGLGLCDLAQKFQVSIEERIKMRHTWQLMNLNMVFPFNEGVSTNYFKEQDEQSCHLNPLRIQFVEIMIMEPREQSAELTEYYQVLYGWLDSGAPEGEPFSHKRGIVQNMADVLGDTPVTESIRDEMQLQFLHAGRNVLFPFNTNDAERILELETGTVYSNEQRLQWVVDHAG